MILPMGAKPLKDLYPEKPNLNRLNQFQRLLAEYLMRGLSNKEIGSKVNLCAGTINNHLVKIYKLTNVSGRIEFILKFSQSGQ